MTKEADSTVIVRRRWNDPHSAKVPLAALRELVIKNDPGGVCIIEGDNSAELNAKVRAMLRR